MAVRVLALDHIHEAGLSLLRDRPDVDLVHLPEPTPQAISEEMERAEILILRGRTLPADDFERAQRLRLVSRHGVGCDNLDLPRLKARGIGVAVAADANWVSVAEHAVALTLAAAKNLRTADRAVREGDWARRSDMAAVDIFERTVLVVGFGRIGRAFAARVAPFGARMVVHDPFLPPDAAMPDGVHRAMDLDEALSAADVVSIHAPLSAETANLFDAARLARMKSGSLLVNTARGGIVDEAALPAALDDGRPLRYATDVLAEEPPPRDHPLLQREDVILCPHSAAMTAEGAMRMATGSAQNVLDYLDGRLAPAMTIIAPLPRNGDAP